MLPPRRRRGASRAGKIVAAAAKPALGSLYDVAGLPDGLANQHRSTGLPGSVKQTTMGLFKSPWRSKVAAVAAFQSPEPPAEEPAATGGAAAAGAAVPAYA